MPDAPVAVDKEMMKRIARLFIPFSDRAVKRVYPAGDDIPAKFAHYTSADTALKIIRDKRIWMRNTTCMADYREVVHGHEMMMACFANGSRDKLLAALDECRKGIATEAVALFDKNWHDTLLNTFVACFSEHDEKKEEFCGRLSMWRAFAPSATRVALIFAVPLNSEASEIGVPDGIRTRVTAVKGRYGSSGS
jgi:hypothetical protein